MAERTAMRRFKISQELESTLDETLDLIVHAIRSSNFSIISKLDISPLQESPGTLRCIILQVAYPRINLCQNLTSAPFDQMVHCNLVLWETSPNKVRVEISNSKAKKMGIEVNHLLIEMMRRVAA